MTAVIFRKAEYDYGILKPIIFGMIDTLGKDFIKSGSRVLIKPNLLIPAKPEKAIVTHPLVVKAVAEYVQRAGGKVQISDSPAMGSFERVLKEGRYTDVFSDFHVKFAPFSESVKKDIGAPFGRIDIAGDALAADVVINLAKLKTHSQMLLTLGVKNLFGCIVGYRKPEWHLRSGVDRGMFARLLVQIYQAIQPSVTIIDGISALEGQGPGKSGKPRELGVLVGSCNAAAADMAICKMFGLDPDRLPTHIAAKAMGLINERISIDGNVPPVSAFKFPVLAPLTFGPGRLQNIMRKHLVQRPVVDPKLCKQCGECGQYCPAKAITDGAKQIQFDYAGCIRCYCCIEVCPHGALRAVETLPGRLIRKLPFIST